MLSHAAILIIVGFFIRESFITYPIIKERDRLISNFNHPNSTSLDTVFGDFNNDKKKDYLVYGCSEDSCNDVTFYLNINKRYEKFLTSNFLNKIYSSKDQFIDITIENKILKINIEDRHRFSIIETFNFIFSDKNNFHLQEYIFWQKDKNDINLATRICTTRYNSENLSLSISNFISDSLKISNCIYTFENTSNLEEFYEYLKNEGQIKFPIIGRLEFYLENYPLSKLNISTYNNIAYSLYEKGNFESSVYLLLKVLSFNPTRTVAYINLGDSYWGLNETAKAKEAFRKYIELMKKSGKENKIPKRVCERIKG